MSIFLDFDLNSIYNGFDYFKNMISVDDFLKIILVISIAFAIVGIAFEIMRLLGKVTSLMEEVRKPIQNASTLTDYALEDYNEVRGYIKSIGNIINGVSGIFSSKGVMNLFKKFTKKD